MGRLLRALPIQANSSLVIWAARINFVVSGVVLALALVGLVPITAHLVAALWRRQWGAARRQLTWLLLVAVLCVYCAASVIDGMDTLDLMAD